VVLAEAFVRDNCYTHLPCDVSRLQPEFMEPRGRPELVLRLRRNSLKAAAYGLSRGTRGGVDPAWTVFFEPTEEYPRSVGRTDGSARPHLRGLYVSPSFQVLHMEHLDLRRDAAEKLIPPPKG